MEKNQQFQLLRKNLRHTHVNFINILIQIDSSNIALLMIHSLIEFQEVNVYLDNLQKKNRLIMHEQEETKISQV